MTVLNKNIPLASITEAEELIRSEIIVYSIIDSNTPQSSLYSEDYEIYYALLGLSAFDFNNGLFNIIINVIPDIYADSLISANLHLSAFDGSSLTVSCVADAAGDLDFDSFAYEDAINSIDQQTNIITQNIGQTANIDITNIISPYITSRSSVISIYLIPDENTNSLLSLNLQTSYISLSYNAVAPFAPTDIAVEPGFKQLFIAWAPPTDNGGDNITGYQVEYTTYIDNAYGEWTIAGTTDQLSFTVNNLINNTEYVFRVAAINGVGLGVYSDISVPEYPRPGLAPRTSNTFNEENYTRIRLRRDLSTNWSGVNPILGLGEAGYESDTRLLKIGDNITSWNDLEYIKADYSDIVHPDPPTISLTIGDSATNEDSPRVVCNLSEDEKLNIVANNGIDLSYNPAYNSLIFSLDQIFTPFNSGILYSPNSRGRPGSVYYDDQYVYMCVSPNQWKRIPLETRPWFPPDTIAISNNSGLYPSVTNIYFSGSNAIITSDGDPYPAKAGSNLTNDGIIPRSSFFNSYRIAEQNYSFSFRYRGGSNTSSPESALSGFNGIFSNGVLLSSPGAELEAIGSFPPPSGFHYNRTFFGTYFKIDDCGGYVNFDRKYSYYDGRFLTRCWDDPKVYNSNIYYSGQNFNGDHYRYTDGHSKILGFAFDGYPIYGPFGYTDSETPESGVSLMTSSYVAKDDDSHRPEEWKYTNSITVEDTSYNLTAGAFIEDFEYMEGSGLLDQYNGRYAVTPEYPEGTYAYYMTFTSPSMLIPAYPYVIGNYSKQTKVRQDLLPSLIPLTVDGYFPIFTATETAANYGLLNGGDGTYSIVVINNQTYYMPNGVYSTSPSVPTDITLSENRISEKATINSIIGTFSTEDANQDDVHLYTLVSGDGDDDNTNFTIYNNELRVNSILSNNIQPTHSIRVRTTDQTNRFFEKTFNIFVLEGTTFTSLNIIPEIEDLIAEIDEHTYGVSTQGTAQDLEYSWSIFGSPYIEYSSVTGSTLSVSGINVFGRADETININLAVKSISAFTTLYANTSFLLDHSELPQCINGYYPLYFSPYDANRDPDGDGTSHMHTVLGSIYWMPNGLPEHYHGNFDCDSL